jgi:transcriptional regulator with PAS, ATPase and Fis domain
MIVKPRTGSGSSGAVSRQGRPATRSLTEDFLKNSDAILRLAMRSLFERLDKLCEGALAVDEQAHIVWINNKYVTTLGLHNAEEALGREVEEVIPNSLMREVVRTGEPILLDIMQFGEQSLVVTRMPLQDENGKVVTLRCQLLYERAVAGEAPAAAPRARAPGDADCIVRQPNEPDR